MEALPIGLSSMVYDVVPRVIKAIAKNRMMCGDITILYGFKMN